MPDTQARESEVVHEFKNYLGIVVGFSDLLLAALPVDDARHADVVEIHKARDGAPADLVKHMR